MTDKSSIEVENRKYYTLIEVEDKKENKVEINWKDVFDIVPFNKNLDFATIKVNFS